MSGAQSKRQQARNEKALQDLVHKIPGNDQCADCHARNPAWASWSLGVFLCMRCAAIHRKLGTHISKVKSLSMDSWSNEQVDNMRKVGNTASNQIYNPSAKKPPIPVDVDEADSAMERFIRQKYIHNIATDSRKPRSLGSVEAVPPPLPPKNSTKFGFRSASSIFPLSSRTRKEQRTASTSSARAAVSPTFTNKPSKLLGSTIDYDGGEDMDQKLARLREMGFQDSQRNAIVLKGVNGHIDMAIEALARLGEGRSRSPGPAPPLREPALRSVKSMTPLNSSSISTGPGNSLNIPHKQMCDRPTTSSTTSTNPFDMLPVAQPQTAQSTGSLHHKNPYGAAHNPFGQTAQQLDLVNQAFQDLKLSTSPSIFLSSSQARTAPHTPLSPLQPQSQLTHQYMSPSVPPSPQQYQYQPVTYQSSTAYTQPVPQSLQPVLTGYNPILSQPSSPTSMTQHMILSSCQGGFTSNPYARSSVNRIGSPSLGQIQEQVPSNFTQQSFMSLSPRPLPTPANPFVTNTHQQQHESQTQPQQIQSTVPEIGHQAYFTQQSCHQQPRHDKASILALYDQPRSVLASPTATESNLATGNSMIPETPTAYSQSTYKSSVLIRQPRSVSQPTRGDTNPFLYESNGTQVDSYTTNRDISRDSVNLGMDMAWSNGRHSPDAFASLSARHI